MYRIWGERIYMTIDLRQKVSLVACSDPLTEEQIKEAHVLADVLREMGLDVNMAPGFFGSKKISPQEKARLTNECFQDPETDCIFDVSGGNLANFVLPHLDYEAIAKSRARFFGYSDLTTVLNAIQAKTGRETVNYQIRNILYDHADEQKKYLLTKILAGNPDESDLECRFLRGTQMSGKVFGGNIRCFLKLAGTPYWPDMTGGILFLESMGGAVYQMMAAIQQYSQIGVFEKISGVLLGTFTRMEREGLKPSAEELALTYVPENIPVARTPFIGHGSDARALIVGKEYTLKAESFIP